RRIASTMPALRASSAPSETPPPQARAHTQAPLRGYACHAYATCKRAHRSDFGADPIAHILAAYLYEVPSCARAQCVNTFLTTRTNFGECATWLGMTDASLLRSASSAAAFACMHRTHRSHKQHTNIA